MKWVPALFQNCLDVCSRIFLIGLMKWKISFPCGEMLWKECKNDLINASCIQQKSSMEVKFHVLSQRKLMQLPLARFCQLLSEQRRANAQNFYFFYDGHIEKFENIYQAVNTSLFFNPISPFMSSLYPCESAKTKSQFTREQNLTFEYFSNTFSN